MSLVGHAPILVPPGENERLLKAAGLQVLAVRNTTDSWASVANNWLTARTKRETALRQIEGDRMVEGQAQVLQMSTNIATEHQLARFAYSVAKPE